jgi:hypothetical protein
MTLPKVYVTRRIQDTGLSLLPGRADFEVWEKVGPVDREILLEKASGADGLLCTLSDRIDEELLSRSPNLKVVSNYAVGYDASTRIQGTGDHLRPSIRRSPCSGTRLERPLSKAPHPQVPSPSSRFRRRNTGFRETPASGPRFAAELPQPSPIPVPFSG